MTQGQVTAPGEWARGDRYAAGKALRKATPRESHADLTLPAGRDPLAILAETDRTRIAALVPRRHALMSVDPYSFFRGAAAVMAEDLATCVRAGLPVQACGDCHLGNFSIGESAAGAPLFDIDDFDETLPAVDFTVDVKRLATSVALTAGNGELGSTTRAVAYRCVRAYRTKMIDLAGLSPYDAWRSRIDVRGFLKHLRGGKQGERLQEFLADRPAASDARAPMLALNPASLNKPPHDWTIADKDDSIFHWAATDEERARVEAAFALYKASLAPERRWLVERYRMTDIAMKVVGVGAVGTFCAVALLTTADGATLFLQIKEAQPSALVRLNKHDPFADGQQGERVVQGQRTMQGESDLFLGWTADAPAHRQFYVRHLKNKRLGQITALARQNAVEAYGELCGTTLARAHARSGDPATLAGYMGRSDRFDDAVAAFAMAYGKQTVADHALFVAQRGTKTLPLE